jgi:small-conductance mechanosensitive channel
MKRFVFILFTLLIFSYLKTSAQKDTVETDSIQDETLELIKRADSTNIADSLEKEVLIRQLEDLSKWETKKRRELEAKLRDMHIKDSLNKIRMIKEIDSLKLIAVGYPVIPYKDTLFMIYTKIGAITASERTKIISDRLSDTYKQFILKFDSLNVVDYGQTADITFKDKTIMSITDYDETWFNKPKLEIANEYRDKIVADIIFFKKNKSFISIAKQIGFALLAVIVLIVLMRLLNLLFKRKIDKYIISQKGKKLKGLNIKSYQFLDAGNLTNVVLFISKITRWFLIILFLYLTLPILFSIFPPTQRLAELLFGYLISPLKKIGSAVLSYLPNLFTILIIIIITRYVLKLVKFISSEIQKEELKIPGFYPDWAKPTFNIIRFLIMAFMFIMIFPYLPGSDSPIFKGVSVFLGVVFSLGSTSVIGNLMAGLVMTYMRPFKIGDRIKIGDIVGDVVERTAFVTRVKTPKMEYITIPNSNVLTSSVINYSTSKEREGIILHTNVTIGYDVPWRQVHEILISAAKKTKFIIQDPEPFVLLVWTTFMFLIS